MRRLSIALAAAALIIVATAAPAFAHVTVQPGSVPQGSDAVLAFVVPNEEQDATTTAVEVQFPHDHPIPEALVEAIPGWSAEVKSFKLDTPIETDDGTFSDGVDNVTWTATGAGIAVEHFQQFRVSVGLPDDTDSLTFPTIQTYSNGTKVNWTQVTPPGGPEPDNPAPVLTLTTGDGNGPTTPTTTGTTSSTVSKSDVDNAQTIAIIAVIVGALGLIAGAVALARSRRKPTT